MEIEEKSRSLPCPPGRRTLSRFGKTREDAMDLDRRALCPAFFFSLSFASAMCFAAGALAAIPEAAAADGGPFDAAPFGEARTWDPGGKDQGVVWEAPRDIIKVVAAFAPGRPIPPGLRVEYWQSAWPHRRIPRDRPLDAGAEGPADAGDWFRGTWRTADSEMRTDGSTVAFTFRPVSEREFPEVAPFAASWRTTLQVRLAAEPEADVTVACSIMIVETTMMM